MTERQSQRFDVAVGVIVRHGGTQEPCMSRTLSPRGLFLATHKRWPLGTAVGLEIVHQDLRIPAKARVAAHAGGGVGLAFEQDDPGLSRAIDGLLRRFVNDQHGSARFEVADAQAAWELPTEGARRGFFQPKRRKVALIDLSLDGAAVIDKKPPEVGESVLFWLPDPYAEDGFLSTSAEVVRHTERGFAVRFASPSTAFRRAVSEIRRAQRLRV